MSVPFASIDVSMLASNSEQTSPEEAILVGSASSFISEWTPLGFSSSDSLLPETGNFPKTQTPQLHHFGGDLTSSSDSVLNGHLS